MTIRWKTCSAWPHRDEPVQYQGHDCPLCLELESVDQAKAELQQLQQEAQIMADVLLDWHASGTRPGHLDSGIDVAERIARQHGRLMEAWKDEMKGARQG